MRACVCDVCDVCVHAAAAAAAAAAAVCVSFSGGWLTIVGFVLCAWALCTQPYFYLLQTAG